MAAVSIFAGAGTPSLTVSPSAATLAAQGVGRWAAQKRSAATFLGQSSTFRYSCPLKLGMETPPKLVAATHFSSEVDVYVSFGALAQETARGAGTLGVGRLYRVPVLGTTQLRPGSDHYLAGANTPEHPSLSRRNDGLP